MRALPTIISGGQSGVDRAALDAALDAGVACGGWCPKGRLAEDGPIPARYPLQELGGGYRQRTLRNLQEADGTVIVYFGTPSGGTELTLASCIKHKRPYLLIDAEAFSVALAVQRLRAFVRERGIAVLNVAGPRASGEPRAYDFTYRVIGEFLRGD